MATEIYDLSTTSPEPMTIYQNDLDPVENLLTQYIIDFYGATQIYNAELRTKLKTKIIAGSRTAALGFYTVATGK